MTNNELMKLKRTLSKAYDEDKLRLTRDASTCVGWCMTAWQSAHCRNGFAQYSAEQYNRALKKCIIGLCIESPAIYTIA